MNPSEMTTNMEELMRMRSELQEEMVKMKNNETIDKSVLDALNSALSLINSKKSSDRQPKDRYLAICVTEIEKVIAFYTVYCK